MHSARLHAVVIAGGSGTRFWPLSRKTRPKQLLNLTGEGALLQLTFERVKEACDPSRWWMVVGAAHAEGCRKIAPGVKPAQVLVEPYGRNTAPAIALAALHVQARDKDGLMVVLPADHHVADKKAFVGALQEAAEAATTGSIVTLGIEPTRPETGFGYIEMAARKARGAASVKAFYEKPDVARAQRFVDAGNFLWNAGIYVMQPERYLSEVKVQLPETYQAIMSLAPHIDKDTYETALTHAWSSVKNISIDYGVTEHADDVAVVPVNCGWSDVGSWDALGAVIAANAQGNVLSGKHVSIDSENCIAYADEGHMVALVGVNDLVVVHTEDATLVLPKARAQQVREVLEQVGAKGWAQYL